MNPKRKFILSLRWLSQNFPDSSILEKVKDLIFFKGMQGFKLIACTNPKANSSSEIPQVMSLSSFHHPVNKEKQTFV